MGDLAGDTGSGPYKESPGRLVPGAGLGGSSTSPAGMAIGAPLRHSSLPEGKVGRAVESAGSDTGRTSADLGASYRKVSDDTGELAAICRGVDDVTERLIEYRNVYEPDDLVSPGDAADLQELLAKQVAALQEFMTQTRAGQSALAKKVDNQLAGLEAEIAGLREQQEPAPWSLFDSIGHAVLRMTVGAILGGLLGGPAIAYLLHEPVLGKLIEGLVGGAVGGLASDVADPIDRPTTRHVPKRGLESPSATHDAGLKREYKHTSLALNDLHAAEEGRQVTARNESEQDEPTGVLSLTLDNADFVDSPRGGIVGETPEVGFPHDEGVARFSDDIAYVDANEALDKPEKVQRPAYEDYGIRRDDHEI